MNLMDGGLMTDIKTKSALVTGAGGFIGHHLVKRLKSDGYWVRGVDIKDPEYGSTCADEFLLKDLRELDNCVAASQGVDEVYNFADAAADSHVLLTTERLVHRSLPNTTETVRWSLDSRYSQIGLPNGRPGVPGFVARSRQNPQQVAQSLDDWEEKFCP